MNVDEIQRYEIIQNFILPGEHFSADEPLYLKSSPTSAQYMKENRTIYLQAGGWVLFDTFFNSLSVGFWKENCAIEDLSFGISGSGRVIARFGLYRTGYSHDWLLDKEILLDENSEERLPLPFWPALRDGILYARVYALEPSTITACSFMTESSHIQNVKLGVCITHFNRQQFLLPAVERIKSDLFNDAESNKRFHLVIVDNSNNLKIEQSANITIIPNRNYGGSGGFARGLLHLSDEGSFTHCLFMDDDASCEIESIRRTWQILAFSKHEELAIAGSLLRANETFRLFEKGARFDGLCRPNKQWLDMRSVSDLLAAEEPVHIDYGGWWFFAFSINKATHYPFPFFVRGDDILFSLMNRFRIRTLNGIACWGEDFSTKHSPFNAYLDNRYHILIQMLFLK